MKYYIVGGFVRDELLGVRSKDIDYAVEAESYDAMRNDILSRGMVIFQERPEYLSIRARHPVTGPADFTVCRTDGFYSDSRRPDTVHIGSIYDDLSRRDFTVNAIAKTEDGKYIDPHNGISDLKNMHLRCVGDTYKRFTEDPLRMLRAMRFFIVRGFALDEDIVEALSSWDTAMMLLSLPSERMYDEVNKCFEFSTWKTLQFLDSFRHIKAALFIDKLELRARVTYGEVAQLVEATDSKSV